METIVDRLRCHAEHRTAPSAAVYLTRLNDPGEEENKLEFSELATQSQRVADELYRHGMRKSDRVVLLYPSNVLEFMPAFMGCIWAGVIPGSRATIVQSCCEC